MLDVKPSTKFKKGLKKFQHTQAVIDDLDEIIHLLRAGKKLPEKNRDHNLIGGLVGYRECHVRPDVLLVYKTDEKLLYLAKIGSHSDIFG